jgi:hypothetical protein
MNIGDVIFVFRKKPEAESHFIRAVAQVQPEPAMVSFINFDGSVNVGGFTATGEPFALTGLKVADAKTPPTLPYYGTSPPTALKPVVTSGPGTAQPAVQPHAATGAPIPGAQQTNKAASAKPVVTR